MAYPERSFDSATDIFPDDQYEDKTVPALLDRLISSYTHKSYNTHLRANLAAGITQFPVDANVPAEVKSVLQWHNGCIDPYGGHVTMLPGSLRLLSLDEAVEIVKEELQDVDDEDCWNSDIFPIFARENRELMIIVSRSTGKSAYRQSDSSLTDPDDMRWFPSLYALLRKIEVAMEAGRLCVRFKSGTPWSIDYEDSLGPGVVAPITVDSEDEREANREESERQQATL